MKLSYRLQWGVTLSIAVLGAAAFYVVTETALAFGPEYYRYPKMAVIFLVGGVVHASIFIWFLIRADKSEMSFWAKLRYYATPFPAHKWQELLPKKGD